MRWLIYGISGLLMLIAVSIAIVAVKVIDEGPSETGGLIGQPTVGGPFTLINGDGATVTEKLLLGKISLVYFGFTFCPDVCPVDLANIADALDLLKKEKLKNVQVLFVTVDPERDTQKVVSEYAAAFHPNILGLTGSAEQIREAARSYRVYYAKQDNTTDDNYLVSHSAYTYLMDTAGKYVKHFRTNTSPEEIAEGLKNLIRPN
jgi:protein SCO1/2